MNKFLQTLIAIGFCFFLSHHSNAQQWKHYSAKSKANCFLVAKDSTLWVGTDGGVIHYDKNYKVIESDNHSNSPDSNVVSLIQDAKGNILASIENNPYGFSWFDGYSWQSTDKMKIPFQGEGVTLCQAFFNRQELWNTSYWVIYDKGTKFVKFTQDSIYNQNGVQNMNIVSFNTISVTNDDSNNIWITNYKTLYLFNGTKWITYNANNSSLPDLAFYSPIADTDGSVLLLTSEGVIRFNPKNTSSVLIKTANPSHLIKTKNGKIFVVREKQILALNGNVLTEYLTDNSLLGVSAFTSDVKNRLIIGTNTNNYLYDGQKLTTLDLPKLNLEENNIGLLEPDTKGNVWVATYWPSKLFKINDSKNEIQSFPYSTGVMAVGKDNTFWMAEGQSAILKQYDGNKWISHTLKENSRIVKIVVDQNNYVWCNLFNWNNYQFSLFWFDGNIWKSLDLEENYLGYGFDIAPKVGGGIWMKDYNLLKSFDGTTITTYSSNLDNKLPENSILLKTSSKGTLWIVADETSIYKFDGRVAQKIQFPPTLRFSHLYDGLFIDKDENLWVGNALNLYKYDGKIWRIFDAENDPINISSITQSADGRIWVGTYNGLFVMTDCVSKPTITVQPKHTSVFEFQKAQLEVKTESATSFEWQLSKDKGLTWKNITNVDTSYVGHLTNILTIKSSNLSQSNDVYRCEISNGCSSVNSDTASVTIKKCLQTQQIIQQPNPQSAIEKSGVQFTVSSSNTSTYQWELSTDAALTWKEISSQDTLYSGQQSNTLNVKSANISLNAFSYRCLLKNECSQIYSLSASLEVITILGNEALIEKSLIAYPNPAYDNLNIKTPIKPYKLTLLSAKGSVIKQVENQDIISVKDIPNGIYILLLETDNAKQSFKITVLK